MLGAGPFLRKRNTYKENTHAKKEACVREMSM
jgi:hypothetical protein